ncbi:hypothetical protein [Nocardia carnea]|uniref:hypothetical protein n=1 Tax=Nocardia carnea TaxID=37328 RepID=UPI0024549ECE|nr:hypothetical protein [Nocardia carnea]
MTYQGQTGTTSTGIDPAYVPDREVFDAYTHQQIWDLARERLVPAELRRVADAWDRAADALESAFDEHARDITRLSGEWSGIAAAAAVHAATALVRAGGDTAGVCRVLGQLMTANADAAESVRTAVPPPPEPYRPDPDPAVEAATGAQRRATYNLAAAAATAAAQDAMTFGYNPAIPASGDSVPRFPAVVTTAPESPAVSVVSGSRGATTPSTEPGAAVGSDPGSPKADPPGPTTPHTDGNSAPGRTGDEPQPLFGNDSAPTPTTPEDGSRPPRTPSDSAPEAGAAEPSAEFPQPADPPAPDPSESTETPAAETAPAAGSAPDTHPARSEPAVQPATVPADRGTGPVGSPGTTDLSPRSPANPPTPATVAPIPPGPGPAGSVHTSPPSVSGGAAPPPHIGPAGGPPAPAHAQGSNTPQYRPAPSPPPAVTNGPGTASVSAPGSAPGAPAPASGTSAADTAGNPLPEAGNPASNGPGSAAPSNRVALSEAGFDRPGRTWPDGPETPAGAEPGITGPGAPVAPAPTASGLHAVAGTAAVPYFPDPAIRPPAGHIDPVAEPPLPGNREALGPAGTGLEGSRTEGHENTGARPVRLVPTGVPLPPTVGTPPPRPVDSERSSPDYLHAPNEELTATDPKVPPVLGEYTGTERAERGDPGGGSR